MSSKISRRSLVKGSAAAIAALPVAKASKTFAAPAVLLQSGPVKITYWGGFKGALADSQTTLVNNFNAAQTDVVVDFQNLGSYEDTAQKLTAALAAGNTPDVALLSDVWWFKFYLNKALLPLNDLIAAQKVDTTDYVDSLINEGVRENEHYWIPFARSTPLFYYNRDLFTAAGLERAPETWDELVQAAPALTVKDGDTIKQSAFAHAAGASYIAWLFQPVVWQYGGAYSDDDFNIKLNQPEAVAAGEFFRSSVVDGWATTPADNEADFTNGLTASMMASTGGLAGLQAAAKFDLATAFLPKGPVGPGVCTGGSGLSILAKAPKERQEAAFTFAAWASSPETTAWWSQNTGYMPVRKSAVESQSMQDFFAKNPNFKTAVDQLPLTKPQDAARTRIPNGDQIIGKGLEQITLEKQDAQPVFDGVAKTLTDEAKPVIEAIKALS